MTLLLILVVGIFFSYSRATLKKQESIADATLKVGTLDYEVKINGKSVNEILVTSGKDWTYLDVSVTSKNSIDTKFAFNQTVTGASLSPQIEYLPYAGEPAGILKVGETKTVRLRARNMSGHNLTLILNVVGGLVHNEIENSNIPKATAGYTESILNGADPVLSSNLIPVNISANGTVTKANVYEEWYRYGEKRWANAVVLTNSSSYSDGAIIPESNIQSYFVWIPRYKYQIFDTGNYASFAGGTVIENLKQQTINVVFENKNTAVSNGSSVNAWLTHPAFTSFKSNGFWVGKFESGYKGASSTTGAQQNNSSSSNLVIKPNIYSWRGITPGNAFKASYDYLRSDDSHMMKNTEWGAVAYLQHSEYGSKSKVRINNNTSYITGYSAVVEPECGSNGGVSIDCNKIGTASSVTQKYNTPTGYLASTTGNITGVYDMSGGAGEYVMGYNSSATKVGGESGITSLYSDFFTNSSWSKYYDKYTNASTSNASFNKRILGDATGEMGPFINSSNCEPDNIAKGRSSWYGLSGEFIEQTNPWFVRGGVMLQGKRTGVFAFETRTGTIGTKLSFRVVLTP